MQIQILVDNTAGSKFGAEHGLSYLINHNNTNVLFDVGHSNLFQENAEKMGINLKDTVDTVVLSHGHWDHGNGLVNFSSKPLITHPSAFIKRYRKDGSPVGLNISKQEVEQIYDLHLHAKPFLIAEGIMYLGEIPRINDFESQTTPFVDDKGQPDFIPDDSALVVMNKGALNIISGCAHSGICNIIEYAKKMTHCNEVNAVIGGFHLKHNNKQTIETIAYFQKNNINFIRPSHCTGFDAMRAFAQSFDIQPITTGTVINL